MVVESILAGSRVAGSVSPVSAPSRTSPDDSPKSQLGRPPALRSSSITGSMNARLVNAISPPSSGPSASARSTDLIRAISAAAAPGTLAMRRSATVILGTGRIETATAPSIATARPVTASRRSVISGLNRSQSRNAGTRNRAATTTARRARIP